MHELAGERTGVAPLFADYRPFLVALDAVLEGRIGSITAEDVSSPSCAMARAGRYVMFGGSVGTPASEEMMKTLRGIGQSTAIGDEHWKHVIRNVFPVSQRLAERLGYVAAESYEWLRVQG